MDYYLAFPDQAAADMVLYTTHDAVTDEEGNATVEAYTTPNYQNIDTLGILYQKPPEDAGEDYVPVPEEGWHVNVRVVGDEDPAPLEQYAVHPTVPRRIWG